MVNDVIKDVLKFLVLISTLFLIYITGYLNGSRIYYEDLNKKINELNQKNIDLRYKIKQLRNLEDINE